MSVTMATAKPVRKRQCAIFTSLHFTSLHFTSLHFGARGTPDQVGEVCLQRMLSRVESRAGVTRG